MMEIEDFGSLPELMRAVLATPADEYQATRMVVVWLKSHPDVLREMLGEEHDDWGPT